MLTTILTTYFAFNLVLALSYLSARLALAGLYTNQTQRQQLKLVRFTFLVSVCAFMLIPVLLHWLSWHSEMGFEIQPLLRQGVDSLQINQGTTATVSTLPIRRAGFNFTVLACYALAALMILLAIGRVKSIVVVRRLLAESKVWRQQQKLYILLNEKINVPFCWSFGLCSYIVLPTSLLQQPCTFRLAIRHELQHLRQNDPQWLYGLALIKIINFWNPFARLWAHWFNELQEFACDEATVQLINLAGTNNAWQLARSPYAPAGLKKYLPLLQASILIAKNPELLSVS